MMEGRKELRKGRKEGREGGKEGGRKRGRKGTIEGRDKRKMDKVKPKGEVRKGRKPWFEETNCLSILYLVLLHHYQQDPMRNKIYVNQTTIYSDLQCLANAGGYSPADLTIARMPSIPLTWVFKWVKEGTVKGELIMLR